ncbi:hypothetical protein M0P65_00820 [Candidatus Gracilibacteria bacterium]|nr:hypothetical protein [Candidatus Gracilibacteria bacterium]
MFKTKIEKIKDKAKIISLKDLKQITQEKDISNKIGYNKGITRLKRGLYSLKDKIHSYEIANKLYYPSYVSLESVLSVYSIIPDSMGSFMSVTTNTTSSFKNNFGTFHYFNVKKELYFGYEYIDGYFIAEKEKALLDYFYLKSASLKLTVYDYKNIDKAKFSSKGCLEAYKWFKEERFENLEIIDFEKLNKYSEKFNKKVFYMALLLQIYYKMYEQTFV